MDRDEHGSIQLQSTDAAKISQDRTDGGTSGLQGNDSELRDDDNGLHQDNGSELQTDDNVLQHDNDSGEDIEDTNSLAATVQALSGSLRSSQAQDPRTSPLTADGPALLVELPHNSQAVHPQIKAQTHSGSHAAHDTVPAAATPSEVSLSGPGSSQPYAPGSFKLTLSNGDVLSAPTLFPVTRWG